MLDKTGVAGFTSDPSLANSESVVGINVEDITVDIGSSRILTDAVSYTHLRAHET